jgi:cellulose biosynthesis protein BcsQ
MATAKVEVVGGLKGGIGKTRLAMLAALWLATVEGEDVHVICGDKVSQTAYDWFKDYERARAATPDMPAFPVQVTRHPFDDVDELIAELRKKHDHVVVDVGGGDVAVLAAALKWADRLFVPVGADPSDARRLRPTWKAAEMASAQSEVGGFDAWVLLSKTNHSTTLPREYRRILTGLDPETGEKLPPDATGKEAMAYPLLEAEMRYRVAYARAYGTLPTDFLDVPAVLREAGVIQNGAAKR